MQKLVRIFVCVMLLTVAGCAEQQLAMERNNLAGYSEPYKDGYTAGCGSGTSAAGNPYHRFSKDVARFESDPTYSQGWTDGFNVCKGKYESIGR